MIERSQVKKAAIDPKTWFMSHSNPSHASDADSALAVGREAIDTHSDVVSAMTNSPDLRVEIALAYLAAEACVCSKAKIVSLARMMEQL